MSAVSISLGCGSNVGYEKALTNRVLANNAQSNANKTKIAKNKLTISGQSQTINNVLVYLSKGQRSRMAMTMMIPTITLSNSLFGDENMLSGYGLDCEPNSIFSFSGFENSCPDSSLASDNKSTTRDGKAAKNCMPVVDKQQLTEHDILVGRHKIAFNHIGNRRFRAIISSFLPQYFERTSRKARSKLILEIVDTIQLAGGNFLKLTPDGRFEEISENEKRNKVGHSLRDAAGASKSNKSTTKKPKKGAIKKTPQQTIVDSMPKQNDDDICSLLDDDSIGVDFPIDLDLLLSMP